MIGNPSHTFKPPGRCIYCGSSGDPDLQREHIIPKGMRGRLVFQKASCAGCGSETHAVEGRVINRLFGSARHITGIKPTKEASLRVFSKKADRGKRAFELHSDLADFAVESVAPDDHIGGCIGFELAERAGILQGRSLRDDDELLLVGPKIYLPEDFQERGRALGLQGKSVLIGGTSTHPFSAEDLGRFLAKIAHSYAVAVHGLNSFKYFLTHAVRGLEPMHLAHYIGRIDPRAVPPLGHRENLHILEDGIISVGQQRLLVVRVRLLAVDDYPAYDVVVGETVSPEQSREGATR